VVRTRVLKVAAAVTLLVTAAACGSGSTSAGTGGSAAGGGKTTVTVGYLPALSAAPILSPAAKAVFDKHGLDLKTQAVTSGPQAVPLLLNGELDMVSIDPGTATLAVSQKVPVGIAAGINKISADPAQDYVGVLVQTGSPIQKAADLNGKTIGVPSVTGLTPTLVSTAIDKLGGDSKTVKYAAVAQPEAVGALEQGRFDAVISSEPFMTTALTAGKSRLLFHPYTEAAPGVPNAVFVTSTRFATEKPATVKAFNEAMTELNGQLKADPNQVRQGLAALGTVPAEVLPKMPPFVFVESNEQLRQGLTTMMTLMVRYGQLQAPVPMDDLFVKSAN
jgi:NitT/TauT family transport system substrate-binding protein